MRNYGDKNCSIKSGDRFGVLEYLNNKHKIKDRWEGEFKCECGNIKYMRIDRVIRDCNTKYKKCTCKSAMNIRKEFLNSLGDDYKYYILFSSFKNQAKNKKSSKWPNGLDFELTYLDIKNQYLKQGGLCFYSGQKIRMPDKQIDCCNIDIASIDRIDSSKHYTADNIVLVTKEINLFKSDKSQERFLYLCKLVYENSQNDSHTAPTASLA